MTRKEITEKLYEAVTFYFVKKLCSVHREVGVERWGRARLDAMCIDYKTNIVGVEVKSCLADYRTDKKWKKYLSHCNKLYFCFPPSVIKSRKFPEIKAELAEHGVGILTLSETSGRIRCIKGAQYREVSTTRKFEIYKKLAWIGGDSKRNIKRTRRVYLE